MDKATIISVIARETYSDSGYPAVEVSVTTEGGSVGVARCNESYTTSKFKPQYLYDGGSHFHGLGVKSAAEIINNVLGPAMIGMAADYQALVDEKIKETLSKNGVPLYVNITSPVSIAILHAGAKARDVDLYRHIGGQSAFTLPVGGHLCASGSKRYDSNNKAQGRPHYILVAYGFDSFEDANYALWETANKYEKIISKEFDFVIHRGFSMTITKDSIKDDYVLWDALNKSIKEAGYEGKIGIHADIGANEYYNRETKLYEGLFCKKPKTREEVIEIIEKMVKDYSFIIIQDPLEQNDIAGHAHLVETTGVQIVGDDIFSSNVERIKECIIKKCVNSVILPVNRFTTFSDAIEVVRFAKSYGVDVMARDLCGEGPDVAAYAIGFNAGTIYEGGMDSNGNAILIHEEEIGPRSKFYGKDGIQGRKFSL